MNKKPKKLPPKVENMSKEELLAFLKKKRECEAAAQKIVLSLIENGVQESDFLKYLPYISQTHYDDITEERAISKICGYPLCPKTLDNNLPTQQYKISVKTNRVFDITARKNFCSNGCYKASIFIKEQILTSPLWCRELGDVPKFSLCPLDTAGVLGEEVELNLVKKVDVEDNKNNSFSSLLDFTEASLAEMSLDREGKNIAIDSVEVTRDNQESNVNFDNKITDLQPNLTEENQKLSDNSSTEYNKKPESKYGMKNSENYLNLEGENKLPVEKNDVKKFPKSPKTNKIVGDVIERRVENKIDPMVLEGQKLQAEKESAESEKKKEEIKNCEKKIRLKDKKVSKRSRQPIPIAVIHIETCMGEWITLETLLFLFGEEKVKQMVSDKGNCIKEYLNNMANGLFYKSTSYDQYQQLCRKLNLLELEDRRYDSKITQNKDLKPLPHYSVLQEESKKLDLKVRAYFKGELEIPEAKSEITSEIKQDRENEEEEVAVTNIPLVDKTAQNALRRKIVLTSLNKVLPDLLQALSISSRDVSGDIRLLVATFDLKAHNIMFKPAQWSMIAMIFIKLLSVRDVRLKKALETEKANKHMQLLLMSYEQDGGYLDRLVTWLTDVDRMLDSEHTQLTIGRAVH